MVAFTRANVPQAEPTILVWPDSSLIRSGKPVFMPDHKGGSSIVIGLASRIDRLGKSIRKQYSERYFNKVAPLAVVLSKGNEDSLIRTGKPCDMDFVADYTIVCGEFVDKESIGSGSKMDIAVNGPSGEKATSKHINCEELKANMEDAIVEASRHNTLKTGDLIVLTSFASTICAVKNYRLDVSIDGNSLLNFKMK